MRKYFFLLSCLSGAFVFAQNHDSIPERVELEQTVISGQFNKQSVKKSIYEVKVIDRDMIDRLAGNNLADVLNQSLNMNIIGNSETGKSSVSMFGLDGKYFKILVDNIPLLNDEGLGNNSDLTQMNLDDIEQVEIVEGSMGVDYGANAIAGVINIITKKGSKEKFNIAAFLQEETAGDEYNLRNQGRHVQGLKIGHNFSKDLYGELNFQRNDFKGYWGERKGKYYPFTAVTDDDSKRGYEWLPKEQNSAKMMLRFKKPTYQLFYRFEYFNEEINFYNPDVSENPDPITDTKNPTARDNIYTTERIYNLLNASGRYKETLNYDFSFSYQSQKRKQENFGYEILNDVKNGIQKSTYESRDGYYSKGMISNFINKEKFDFQVGYEVNYITGFAAIRRDVYTEAPVDRKLGSYDFFASSEIKFNGNISLRPGYRVMFSNLFETQHAVSLSSKFVLPNDFEVRLIVGTAPRTPNFDELFTYYVDVNHDIQGNVDLKPENGYSAFAHLKKSWKLSNNLTSQNKLSFWLINLEDKIYLVQTGAQSFRYQNIDKHNSHGVTYNNDFDFGNFRLGIGATVTGIKQNIDDEILDAPEAKFFYTANFNANASYTIPKTQTTISAFFKYNGRQELYATDYDANNNAFYYKGVQNDYSWFDASIRQAFFNKKFELTLGARNLLDVKSVRNSTTGGDAHGQGTSAMLLGYGRSYFVKLLYNLKIN